LQPPPSPGIVRSPEWLDEIIFSQAAQIHKQSFRKKLTKRIASMGYFVTPSAGEVPTLPWILIEFIRRAGHSDAHFRLHPMPFFYFFLFIPA
jgi:hypothetical protein